MNLNFLSSIYRLPIWNSVTSCHLNLALPPPRFPLPHTRQAHILQIPTFWPNTILTSYTIINMYAQFTVELCGALLLICLSCLMFYFPWVNHCFYFHFLSIYYFSSCKLSMSCIISCWYFNHISCYLIFLFLGRCLCQPLDPFQSGRLLCSSAVLDHLGNPQQPGSPDTDSVSDPMPFSFLFFSLFWCRTLW